MRGVFDRMVRPFGYRVIRKKPKIDPDIASDADFMRIYEVCDPFTMTSIERMYGLYRAVRYVVDQDILATLSSAASGWVAVRWSPR